ncbi:TPM domain-containing protein [Candidatus Dojkabacteria bacterium]|nr:TPM domain-containing protein [Candidatus Dojkabacteria bacterium]
MLKKVLSSLAISLIFTVVLVGINVAEVSAADPIDFPDPEGKYVNDFANVINNDEQLDSKLEQFDEKESTQILVITVNKLPEDFLIDEFIPALTDRNPEWAAGQEEYDNGVIFTIVIDDREMRIDVGYGLEGALTDLETQEIQEDVVKPYFKEGDYSTGIEKGVEAIMEAVTGEYSSADLKKENGGSFGVQAMICGAVFLFIVLPYMSAFLGRTRSWWMGGVVGFGLSVAASVWLGLSGALGAWGFLSFFGLAPVLTVLGLVFDYILSKNYKVRKKRGIGTGFVRSLGGFSSRSFSSSGFSSSSGGSSGGFSSGGGSFGGGGSSSKW